MFAIVSRHASRCIHLQTNCTNLESQMVKLDIIIHAVQYNQDIDLQSKYIFKVITIKKTNATRAVVSFIRK